MECLGKLYVIRVEILLVKILPSILSIKLVEIITSSKTGTDPPTKPVFPPWGQIANFLLTQWPTNSATSFVVFGFRTILLCPRTVPSQSVLYPEID